MTNNRIIKILILLSVMFLSLIGYLTYLQVFMGEELASNPYNKRQWEDEMGIQRGMIMDCNGTILAQTVDSLRVYPYKNLYSHIIGYNSQTYGKINLEKTYNNVLLNKSDFSALMGSRNGSFGNDILLTIDHGIQKYAHDLMGDNNGAVVAINPKSGEIIAMVSKPDFDPNDNALIEGWGNLIEDESSPFLPRATQGLYAPGSTFKIITALCAVENGMENLEFEDNGTVEIGGYVFGNQKEKAYGVIDLARGFSVSSNVVFCTLGDMLGTTKLLQSAQGFGFNKGFDFDIEVKNSTFPEAVTGKSRMAALGIGQDEILATPLQMAMVTCGIANGGRIMKPYLVKEIYNKDGDLIKKTPSELLYTCGDSDDTEKIKEMMVETVKSGTGYNASISGVTVAGKTGTAENEKLSLGDGSEHTWFVAFAPAESPEIAVAVMMEYSGGSGGGNCAPIAAKIIKKYLNK